MRVWYIIAQMSADPHTIRYTIPCSYVGLNGVCGKSCFRGVCTRHRDRKPLQLCLRCGVRGTTAPHGYCSNRESGCQWRAQYRSKLAKGERDEMEAYLDEILSWDWPAWLRWRQTGTQATVACVVSGSVA